MPQDPLSDRSPLCRCFVMADRVIRILCPNLICRRVLSVAEKSRGKVVCCRRCGTHVRVPRPGESGAENSSKSTAAAK